MADQPRTSPATGTIHRASVACQNCRVRKVKCDAQSSTSGQGCTPCRRAGHECLLDPLSDGRRFISRKVIDKLQQRIESLEARNQSASIVTHPSAEPSTLLVPGTAVGSVRSLGSVRTATRNSPVNSAQTIKPVIAAARGSPPPISQSTADEAVTGLQARAFPNATSTATAISISSTTTSTATTTTDTAAAATTYESPPPSTAAMSRHGGSSPESLREEPPSYYGATSHPHVVSLDDSEPRQITVFDELDVVGIDLDVNSPHLRAHLLQSFFKYQILWVNVVNKDAFLHHQALHNNQALGVGVSNQRSTIGSSSSHPSRWYSKFLESAMLACGARLSTSKAVRMLGSKYCAWAKDEIMRAMAEPTPASLQGFMLLSEYEVTQGNNRLGWMFCGMACRMLSDLGLHELASIYNNSPRTAPSDPPPERECELARDLLSACIAYEGVWTLYLGRPSSIPKSVMGVAAAYYQAYSASQEVQARMSEHSRWLNAWVGLCVPMAEISDVLNERSLTDAERSASLRRLLRVVEDWYGRLPPELMYDENHVASMDPAAYGLHTQYCKVQILLRRALVARASSAHAQPQSYTDMLSLQPDLQSQAKHTSSQPPSRKRRHSNMASGGATDGGDAATYSSPPSTSSASPPPSSSSSDAAASDVAAYSKVHSTSIYHYAFRIARLVVTYREAFGVEKIPSIMLDNAVVAATAMIGHLNNLFDSVEGSSGSSALTAGLQRDTIWLRQLLKSMETVQQHFPIIGRMLESLKRICGKGPLSRILYGRPFPQTYLSSAREASDALPAEDGQGTHSTIPSLGPPLDPSLRGQQMRTIPLASSHIASVAQQQQALDMGYHLSGHVTSYVQDSLLAIGNGSHMGWESFGADITPGFFSSGLDSIMLNMPLTQSLLPNLTPEVL